MDWWWRIVLLTKKGGNFLSKVGSRRWYISRRGSAHGQKYSSDGHVHVRQRWPTLELAMNVLVEARDPFLRIREKSDPVLNLEVGRQSTSPIVEAKVLHLVQMKYSSGKEKRRVIRHQVHQQLRLKIQEGKPGCLSIQNSQQEWGSFSKGFFKEEKLALQASQS